MIDEKLKTVFEVDSEYLKSLGDTKKRYTEFEVRLKTLELLGGDVSKTPPTLFEVERKILEVLGGDSTQHSSIYSLRKAVAESLGVDVSKLKNVYEIALAILNAEPVGERYTITFVNYDGTVLETKQVLEGETPTYTGATPTRESDEEYTYTFSGWEPEIDIAASDVTYTAQFTATKQVYTIKFVNYDGSVLGNYFVAYGATPSYLGETPIKPSDEEYNYTFIGWLPEISPVSGNTEYVAQFEATEIPEPLTGDFVTFKAEEAGSTIGLEKLSTNQILEYRTDATNWTTMDTSTSITLANVDDEVYVRGILSGDNTSSDYTQFKMTGKIVASGNCNAIWNYQDLEAQLKAYCGCGMFKDCTSLTTAPELPATTLPTGCYREMFYGCTSLVTGPSVLPATNDVQGAIYSYMFYGCTSLVESPIIYTTASGWGAWNSMFYNCSSLNKITCLSTDVNFALTNWVVGVSPTGTLYKNPDVNDWEGSNYVPTGWTIEDYEAPYVTFTAEQSNSTVGLEKLSTNQTLEYSTDTTNWTTMDTSTNISLPNVDDKVYIRGILSANNSSSNYTQFKMTGKIAASGNCNAIWNYQDLEAKLKTRCGYYMFRGCSALTTAPELPATTLANNCYERMFQNCTNLTTAPELPATTLQFSCYSGMFAGCSALTPAPELPATTLASYCYEHMFHSCSALTTAPELPATTLASNCYNYMFGYCSKLNSITCLATDISASYCTYNWVYNVSSTGTFIKDPNMTAWTTGNKGIPSGWTVENYGESDEPYVTFTAEEAGSTIGLSRISPNQTLEYSTDATTWNTMDTSTSISLPNTEDKVYIRGILSADNIIEAPTQFSITGRVAASGNCNAIWNYQDLNAPLKEHCGSEMFKECSLTTAPELPATELAYGCYYEMFRGCTSLTTAPELPATTLVDYCYKNMFVQSGLEKSPILPAKTLTPYCYDSMFVMCNLLSEVTCLATDISATSCTGSWLDGAAGEGTFIKDPNMTAWTTGSGAIPSGWTVEDYTG